MPQVISKGRGGTEDVGGAVAWLVPIAGPLIEPIQLQPREGSAGVTMGRHEACDLCLPADAEKVSRNHARFSYDAGLGQWRLSDLSSRWGTFLNGHRVTPGLEMPLRDGDLVRIAPWTFTLSPTPQRRGLQTQNDAGQTMVRSVAAADATRSMAEDMLALLLESAAAIHGASDEKQLAELVMDAAIRGTGLQNAAVIRPIDAAGHIEILASRQQQQATADMPVTFSRSLMAAASTGTVAEISGSLGGDVSQSIVQMKIAAALCVPLVLGGTVAQYLYLDSRGNLMQTLRQNASAFCVALGRMASLALSNLKRIEMEGREQLIKADLAAAATAQRWILPQRCNTCGGFTVTGESKPGQYVGGDFFDIIELSPTRIAVAVGDVAGKGMAASVLMTATQGFLHASLAASGGLVAESVNLTTRFVSPRRPDNKFVTMWVGIFDRERGEVQYVDAGHSYALLKRADGTIEQLDKGGGLPVGIDDAGTYEAATAKLGPGDEVVIVSDGIIEQYGLVQCDDGRLERQQFEVAGLSKTLANATASTDLVSDVMAAVVNHAGTTNLSDDATTVLVQWT